VTSIVLQPGAATLSAHVFENPSIGLPLTLFYRIAIPLEPFTWDGEEHRTTIALDFISFPVASWRDLPGREFTFPVNPTDGYIDGSVYLGQVHNPADTTRIQFSPFSANGMLQATFEMRFDFEHEGPEKLGIVAVNWTIDVHGDPSELDAVMLEAERRGALR
jgi:hypothetical protein